MLRCALRRALLVLSLAFTAPPTTAAILAYDTFDDYDSSSQFVNSLWRQNSGIGLRGYWDTIVPDSNFARDDLYKVVSPGLSGARRVDIVADSKPNEATRYLEQPITEGRTVYIRAEIEPTTFVRDSSRFGFNLVFSKIGGITAGMIGAPVFSITGVDSTTPIVAGTTYLLVVKVEILPGKDRISLYNITSLSTVEPQPIAIMFLYDLGNLDRIGFSTINATVSYDSLVVADTFSEVISPSLPTPPKISYTLPTITEGNAGTNSYNLSFTLPAPSSRQVRFSYRTIPFFGTNYARQGEDFPVLSGEIIFPPGSTSQTLSLSIIGDTASEPDELLPLLFYTPVNASFTGTRAEIEPTLVIKNDDTAIVQPSLTIQRQTNSFLIQWNAGSGGNLEFTETFPPTSGWTTVSPVTSGQTYSATLPFTTNPRYFRTRR